MDRIDAYVSVAFVLAANESRQRGFAATLVMTMLVFSLAAKISMVGTY